MKVPVWLLSIATGGLLCWLTWMSFSIVELKVSLGELRGELRPKNHVTSIR